MILCAENILFVKNSAECGMNVSLLVGVLKFDNCFVSALATGHKIPE